MKPGVYLIRNTRNGIVYVGSSKRVRKRIRQHVKELNRGTHHNVGLQRDWFCFGADSFVFGLLIECAISELKEAETRFFGIYGLPDQSKGYNHPDAYPYHPGKNRTDLARKKMLSMRDSNPQWMVNAKEKSREFFSAQAPLSIVSPDGLKIESRAIRRDLADVIGCSPKQVYALIGGGVPHVGGWALESTPRTKIFDQNGTENSFVSISSFKKFIGEPKIDIRNLLNGSAKSSKGWAINPSHCGGFKWAKKPKKEGTASKTIIILCIESGLTNEFKSRGEAARFLKVDKADVYAMLRGTRKTIKGWRLVA